MVGLPFDVRQLELIVVLLVGGSTEKLFWEDSGDISTIFPQIIIRGPWPAAELFYPSPGH